MTSPATTATPVGDGYHEVAPHPALRSRVECFWFARGASAAVRILPDGCCDFLFDAEPGGGSARLVGAMTTRLLVPAANHRDLLGVRFHPGGARAFVPAPLREFTDAAVELVDIDSRLREVAATGLRSGAVMDRVHAVQQWLLRSLPTVGDGGLDAIDAALLRFRNGDQRIDAAAADAGCSRQHFTRVVRARTGLSPKLLARILRLRRALAAAAAPAAQIAARFGYADQAHLARDVRELTGSTWKELRA